MTAKLTKKRDGAAWRIHVNGRPTPLIIIKGEPPKYGYSQEYDLCHDEDDRFMFTTRSVGGLMDILETLAEEFAK